MNSGPVTDETLSLQFKRCYHSSGRTDFEYGPRGAEGSSRRLWDEELEPLLQESGDLARQTRRVLGPGSEAGIAVYEYLAYVVGNAAAWPSLAGVLKTYLRRRSDRKVVIYGDEGQKLFEATGDLSASEIEALLRARFGMPEVDDAATLDQEASAPGIAPKDDYVIDQSLRASP